MNAYKEYENLLTKTYDEAVEFLLQKYGAAQYDYFSEKSYQRFENGEIKNITRGKYKRTNEGLYCHHIDEIKELKISDPLFIKKNKIPFQYQKKDRLVYCDLIEHTILHILITKETSHEFGAPGYEAYLKPMIEEWYVDKFIPKPEWMKACRNRSFLSDEEAILIVKAMEETLGRTYYDTPFDFHDARRRREQELEEALEERRRKADKEWEEISKACRESELQIQRRKAEEFYYAYPRFKDMGIHLGTPRAKVIALLYDYKFKDSFKTKKELDLALKPFIKDKLFKELYLALDKN
ncbi:hypothetical protein [Salinicoccus cyprini]|uniref:hypothetical protein n=1 Tax=Salinicoccus cyprini TaxID=2493691 RepID=UPI001FEA58FD|nr:hypothetical protein [Salinicoccus cyprini]